jgi:hypothetical protein
MIKQVDVEVQYALLIITKKQKWYTVEAIFLNEWYNLANIRPHHPQAEM